MVEKNFSVKVDVIFELDGRRVLDLKTAKLLLLIDRYGSILAASKSLGIPYSRAWEALVRAERLLGERLVEVRRGGKGGGGAKLTNLGRKLLEDYVEAYRRVTGRDLEVQGVEFVVPDLTYMGSHDPGVEILAGILRKGGVKYVELSWVGSGVGLAALALGEADVVGTHLLDPETGEYNRPYIRRYWLEMKVSLIRGYCREVGFMTREPMTYEEVIESLLRGELKVINRQRGSGTRVLFEYVLSKEAKARGRDPEEVMRSIPGFDSEVRTHTEVASAVAGGEADVGLGIKWAATQYGLHFISVKLENFDFVVLKDRHGKEAVNAFIEALKTKEFKQQLSKLQGYVVPEDIGEEIPLT